MGWWRRRSQEEDLEPSCALISNLRPRNKGIWACHPLKPATPHSAHSATQRSSRRRHAPCGDGHQSKHLGKTCATLCEQRAGCLASQPSS
jgi:hypothetical protein